MPAPSVAPPDSSPFSSSSYLLGLLGFELLLKLVYEASTGKEAPHRHAYDVIFRAVPARARGWILIAARTRIGPSALGRRHYEVLKELGSNFVRMRYPWESYKGLTEQEYARLGSDWIAKGGRARDATFRHYPEELFALTDTLRRIAEHLARCDYDWTAFSKSCAGPQRNSVIA